MKGVLAFSSHFNIISRYVLKTLEQLVTQDYVLLYLHGGSSKSNVPSFPWLKRLVEFGLRDGKRL